TKALSRPPEATCQPPPESMRDSIRPPVQGRSCWHRVPATLRLTTAKKPTRRRSATCPETSGMWSVGGGNDRNRPIHDDSGKNFCSVCAMPLLGTASLYLEYSALWLV